MSSTTTNVYRMFCGCQVPGLFEGDEYTTLMTQCKEGSQREGLMLDSSEELYKWFTQQVGETWHLFLFPSQFVNLRGKLSLKAIVCYPQIFSTV